jgi:hypothetical protein
MLQMKIQMIEVRQRTKKDPKPSEKDTQVSGTESESIERNRCPNRAATYHNGENMGEETDMSRVE